MRILQFLVVLWLGLIPNAVQAATHSCLLTTAVVEHREKIPRGLLYAIALTESGRWDRTKKLSQAWPWTVRAAADAFVVESKHEATNIVRRLQQEGRKNIDVGCMQVNLRYHPDAFPDLETAFEPLTNITYAATFLRQLRQEARSWQQAIEWYHSRDPVRGRDYRHRVYRNWQAAQIDVNKAHRALRRVGWIEQAALVELDLQQGSSTPNVDVRPSQAKPSLARPSASSSLAGRSGELLVTRAQPLISGIEPTASPSKQSPLVSPRGSPLIATKPSTTRNTIAVLGVDIVRPGSITSRYHRPIR